MFLKIFIAALIGWLIFSYYSDSNTDDVINWIRNIIQGILHHEVVSENRLNNIDLYDTNMQEYNFIDSQNGSENISENMSENITENEPSTTAKSIDIDTDHDELLKFALEAETETKTDNIMDIPDPRHNLGEKIQPVQERISESSVSNQIHDIVQRDDAQKQNIPLPEFSNELGYMESSSVLVGSLLD